MPNTPSDTTPNNTPETKPNAKPDTMPGQSSENLTDNDLLRAKINLETSRINWLDLQTFFARGQVVQVSSALDLVEVALSLNHDDKQAFEQWLKDGSVSYVTDSLAQQWFESKKELWSVVVAPWVIVQDKD